MASITTKVLVRWSNQLKENGVLQTVLGWEKNTLPLPLRFLHSLSQHDVSTRLLNMDPNNNLEIGIVFLVTLSEV